MSGDWLNLSGMNIGNTLARGKREKKEIEEEIDSLMADYEELCAYIEAVEWVINQQKRGNS